MCDCFVNVKIHAEDAVLRNADNAVASMTNVELHRLVRSISYKPGYKLAIDGRRLRWMLNVPDSYRKYDDLTVVNQWFDIPPEMSKEAAVRLIFSFLAYHEDHEMREYFKVGKQRPFNPHREGTHVTVNHHIDEIEFDIHYDGDDLR